MMKAASLVKHQMKQSEQTNKQTNIKQTIKQTNKHQTMMKATSPWKHGLSFVQQSLSSG